MLTRSGQGRWSTTSGPCSLPLRRNKLLERGATFYVRTFPLGYEARYLQVLFSAAGSAGEAYTESAASSLVEANVDQPATYEIGWRYVLAHELFHRWNPFSLNGVAFSAELEWFKEGFSVFVADRALARTGHISEEVVGQRQEAHHFRRLESSFQEHAPATSIVQSGTNKGRYYDIVYYGGWMAAAWLDKVLIDETSGEWDLERFLRLLLREYGPEGATLTVEALLSEVAELNEGIAERFGVMIRSRDWETIHAVSSPVLGIQ